MPKTEVPSRAAPRRAVTAGSTDQAAESGASTNSRSNHLSLSVDSMAGLMPRISSETT